MIYLIFEVWFLEFFLIDLFDFLDLVLGIYLNNDRASNNIRTQAKETGLVKG